MRERVAPRGSKRLFGEWRMIVGVNDVVREAGVLRVLLEERLQNRRCLQLLRVVLVAGERGLVHRQRIKIRPSMSAGFSFTRRSMPCCVREGTCALRGGIAVGEEGRGGRDVGALARRRRAG